MSSRGKHCAAQPSVAVSDDARVCRRVLGLQWNFLLHSLVFSWLRLLCKYSLWAVGLQAKTLSSLINMHASLCKLCLENGAVALSIEKTFHGYCEVITLQRYFLLIFCYN